MKSTLARLHQLTFGSLVTSLPEQALTRRQPLAANAAAPHLIPCMSARVVYVNELPEGAKLNASVIKALSGGDLISLRDTRGQQITHTFRCALCLVTNFPPRGIHDDPALLESTRVIHFLEVQPRETAMSAHELETYLRALTSGWARLLIDALRNTSATPAVPRRFQALLDSWV